MEEYLPPQTKEKSLGIYGYYSGLLSLIILALSLAPAFLINILGIFTLGFLFDGLSQFSSITNILFNTIPRIGSTIALYIAIFSAFLLIVGWVQNKKWASRYNDYNKILSGAVFVGIVFVVLVAGFGLKTFTEKTIQSQNQKNQTTPPSCDPKVCENLSFSRENNTLSFTLINSYQEDITLTSLYDTIGSCNSIELFKTMEMIEPKVIQSEEPFNIMLRPGERVLITMKCLGGVRFNQKDFNGQIGFKFTKGGQTDLNYHIYIGAN